MMEKIKMTELDEQGQNANIKFHILDDEIMKSYGFGHTDGQWVFCVGITDTISLNIVIYDDCKGRIDIVDDDFLQTYDFQFIILRNNAKIPNIAKITQKKVYDIMCNLVDCGIISGWSRGDYI